jgi:large subunit ribosomal protein L9
MGTTKIILKEKVDNLGKEHDLLDVKRGYALNYLLPQGLAVLATSSEVRRANTAKIKMEEALSKKKEDLLELVSKINDQQITISKKASKNGKLFGSVTEKDIATAVNEQLDILIDDKMVEMESHFKEEGLCSVIINLGFDLTAQLKVNITKN